MSPNSPLSFTHRFEPATDPSRRETLLALHGTGGNEDDLVPLAQQLLPGPAVLSPRGQVLENGMPRFFRRLAEGVFDVEDLRVRTDQLADFIADAARAYGFDPQRVIAIGYSNGANIAASMLLLRPGTLWRGVLFRAMLPLEPEELPDLSDVRVFMSSGRVDPIVPVESVDRLAALLTRGGAGVTQHWVNTGHGLVREEIRLAGEWLAGNC